MAYYLPGYRSGGPVRTIANFVDHFGEEFDIRIVTRDRDFLDHEPYEDIVANRWINMGAAKVLYCSEGVLTVRNIMRLLKRTQHDILYLNSFFSLRFTILPLVVRSLRLAPNRPCIIAPRGELHAGASEIKKWKKKTYRKIARFFGLYSGLRWQASSMEEAHYIRSSLVAEAGDVLVAPDLPPKLKSESNQPPIRMEREPGPLRVVFLSRISRKKNLDFALRVLSKVRIDLHVTVYGPKEDMRYWHECEELLAMMPENVIVNYCGDVYPMDVGSRLGRNDVFLFPTKGENYGHVIHEALMAGLPVMISDQTPWGEVSSRGAGWVLPLDSELAFARALEEYAEKPAQEMMEARLAARKYAEEVSLASGVKDANRELFVQLLNRPS
ncbi:glycosyltransferase family 4 protein [Spiribacter sp. 1M153]|uniref:glycosyltransferase family 4 protein n=1 Tax=Spiribacter roseus TaxID=1855875 RepID=UPI00349FCE93